ncbi:unnamed protein product [Bemisia tabaci]|uniref:AAA-ATPase-like domain-containing protein n=1 Tax=Bemisia tabaci TaxID=7038 RepID=A0A9P0AKQ2_BEMTA|nr:unnamed protein product [Bemisia tabaci]
MASWLPLFVGCLFLLNLRGNDCEKIQNQDMECKNAFLELYATKLYVDKSTFIRDFITMDIDLVLLTFPPKWGKTVAVDMLRAFLQINVDENGNHVTSPPDVFTDPNLKISRHQALIAAHHKQHPVIHVSLHDVQGTTVESMLPPLTEAIARAFDHHYYMQKVFSRAAVNASADDVIRTNARYHLHTFEQIRNRTADWKTLKTGLHMLAETLHAHFGKKVWILIDAYDHPIDIGQTQDLAEADVKMDYLRDLLQETFKDDTHLHKALLSGVMRVAKLNNFYGLSSVVETDMHLNHFLDDFGLKETEVDALFATHNLTGNLVEEAKGWYKGYGISSHVNRVEIVVYNPYSIAQFIKNKNVTNYWVQTQSVDILGNLFKSSEMEAVFLRLLSGESPKVVLEDQVFSSEELHMIHGALTAPSENAKRDLY